MDCDISSVLLSSLFILDTYGVVYVSAFVVEADV